MLINVADPVLQTEIFSILFFAAIFLTSKKYLEYNEISSSHTNELKGIAILMVIFGHTGYFLSSDTRFLFPLSVFAGVGVNLFLFLSGFGLTTSALKTKLSPLKFYKKRFTNIYLPMWLVISLLFLADLFLLNKTYPVSEIINSYLGYFPIADIYTSFNSPLWYFSFIVFYYLIFPLVFSRRAPLLSIVAVILLSLYVVKANLPVSVDVLKLYKLHILAFPIGMLFALFNSKIADAIKTFKPITRLLLIWTLIFIFGYTAIKSGVGKSIRIEQIYSLITMGSLVIVVILKRFHSGFLTLIGIYSYEIYLIQWPLIYRYDFLYKMLPAWFANFAYLALLILLAYLIRKLETVIKAVSS